MTGVLLLVGKVKIEALQVCWQPIQPPARRRCVLANQCCCCLHERLAAAAPECLPAYTRDIRTRKRRCRTRSTTVLPDLAAAWRRACRALRQQPPLKNHLFCTLSRKSSTDLGKDCDTDFADCCDSLTHLQCQSAEASHDHLAACCDKSSRPRTRKKSSSTLTAAHKPAIASAQLPG